MFNLGLTVLVWSAAFTLSVLSGILLHALIEELKDTYFG